MKKREFCNLCQVGRTVGQYDYGYFLHCGCGLHGYEQVLPSSGLGEASAELLN